MARSPTGTFTLVAGNPVVTGTIITSDWANTTMPDIGAALTDSLSRTGQGGMLAPIRGIDGTVTSPSHSFTNFPRSGTYAIGTDETRMSVNGVDRMRWRGAGQPTQTYDSAAGEWRDLGGGGTVWRYEPTIPATVLAGIGYVTAGGQSTLLPANPLSGEAVSFADLNNDWDETPFTLDGNGNTFSQDGSSTYELNLKGAYAHFAFINNEWVIVNFGRLSDAYGLDLDSFVKKDDPRFDDTGWVALTVLSGIAVNDPVAYRITGGQCHIKGQLGGMSLTTEQSMFVLPVEARPIVEKVFTGTNSATAYNYSTRTRYLPDGNCYVRGETGTNSTTAFIDCSFWLD